MAVLLQTGCPYISATDKTWQIYARIFTGWMKAAGLAASGNKQGFIIRPEPEMVLSESNLIEIEQGRGTRYIGQLPKIQFRPIEMALLRIIDAVSLRGGRVNLIGFSSTTWAKAIESLEILGFVRKQTRSILVSEIAAEYVRADETRRKELFAQQALTVSPFAEFINILEENRDQGLTLVELGQMLRQRLGADWVESTATVNAKIMLNWARHADLAPGKFAKRRRKGNGVQPSLFDRLD